MGCPNRIRMWWVWAVCGLMATATPAPAFYWKGWPGSGAAVQQTLIPSGETPGRPGHPGGPPSANPIPPPGGETNQPTPVGPGPLPGPNPVPEPGTGVVAIVGLAMLAARRWRKKPLAA